MNIALTDVNKDNYEDVCDLTVTKDQYEYVADNTWSLVESKFNPSYQTRAICLDGKPVGFFMWVPETNRRISIWRFMVDKHHQNKGIGRKAMQLALHEIKQTGGLEEIEICYKPNNLVAKDFYASFGFVEVGMDENNEEMLAIIKM
ncbi:GNAT family N-acetyltransferase [Photorhabdus heterorhabditis]|uniref:GNAT family N-acetyltransferase n=1 Tax=Photorhabdus heterorhabditis TaxID=880156 RepID=A0A5B0X3Q9_9GAMM|nr:GNAT family N-acetyltransferase [Photorhabdus heterorhabditis]KAA1192931.1 GNAT family N-acetyltransferase [Photorhabdus heterorhabditis]MBS9440576.1 GNAT family N-acetyltransferase [Photorhabdus heterorhabditis]